MENEKKDKMWGKKLTGGVACAYLISEIVETVPATAYYGIGAIVLIAVIYMITQKLSDK